MKKRILAFLCSLALVVSGLWIAPAQSEAADGTIAITATEARLVMNGGYVNLDMSGMPADYKAGNGNFVTQEFIDAGWITFDGGMTAEDYLNGHLTSYLATAGIVQFNWRDRGAGFTSGSSFTIKAGAPLTYKKTDDSIGTVTLDANYTISFHDTDNGEKYWNKVKVSKVVDKGTISVTATNVGFVIDTTYNYNYMNIGTTAVSDWGSAISGGHINADYVDAGYITLDGMTKDEFLGSLRQARLETSNIIQFNYAPRETGFPVGSSFTWHKDAPIYYNDNTGVKSVVKLDATYQFTVVASTGADNHNRLLVTKVLVPENKGTIRITSEGVPFCIDNGYDFINVTFEAPDDWAQRMDEGYVNADYISKGYITFDGGLTSDIFLQNLTAARLEVANIFQFNYAPRETGFPVGSSFIWHKGAPIYYKNTEGGISYKTLDKHYKFTVKEGDATTHNTMSVEVAIIPEYKGEVGVTSEGVAFNIDTTYNYNFINIVVGDGVPNWQSRPSDRLITKEYVDAGYLVLGGGLTSDIFFAGLRSGRLETNNIVQLCYDMREAGFPDGSYFILKKGMPLYYNDTEGGISYVTLDADYKFSFRLSNEATEHNTASITKIQCSVTGHAKEYFAPVAPTYTSEGNVEYWYCPICEGYWLDEACTNATTAEAVKLPVLVNESNLYDVSAYRSGETFTAPTKAGYVFAGWYEDEACTVPMAADVTEGDYYAKFIDADVLSVKAQVTKGTTASTEETNMRFISTVDGLDYQAVGFKIKVGDRAEKTTTSTVVYKQLYANVEGEIDTILPTDLCEESAWFFTYGYWKIPNYAFDMEFVVTPYFVTADGTTVWGETVVKMVSQSYS